MEPRYPRPGASQLSRRHFLRMAAMAGGAVAGGGLLAACASGPDGSPAGSPSPGGSAANRLEGIDRFTIATWGGTSETGFVQAWGQPFTERTGIPVTPVAPIDYGAFRTQVESGNLEWDWMDAEAWFSWGGQDLLADIDHAALGLSEDDLVEMPGQWDAMPAKGLASYLTSYVIGYRTDTDRAHPRNWEEFFDTKAVPGKRCLYNWPYGTVELALLADGVAREDLYPLDLDRAFDKIDTIRDDLIFWNTGAESQQYLVSEAADFVVTWNNRIGYLAQTGMPVGIEWQDNLRVYSTHIVPKDSPRQEATLEWIRVGLDPQNQADLAHVAGFGPTLKSAQSLVNDQVRPWLSTTDEAIEKSVGGMDEQWWGDNLGDVTTKWYEWVGG